MKGYLVGGGVLMGIERWIKCWDKECSRVTWSEVIWGRGGLGGMWSRECRCGGLGGLR